MKKTYELLQISPYNAFTKGRFVTIRNIWTGTTYQKFYPMQNKRKIVKMLRANDVCCYHDKYRAIG